MKDIQAAIILALRFNWSAQDIARRFSFEEHDVLQWLVATRKLQKMNRCRDAELEK